jgi:hypothetical protein
MLPTHEASNFSQKPNNSPQETNMHISKSNTKNGHTEADLENMRADETCDEIDENDSKSQSSSTNTRIRKPKKPIIHRVWNYLKLGWVEVKRGLKDSSGIISHFRSNNYIR